MNQELITQTQAEANNPGQWSVKDEKLRITYKNSEESVLFEDTASISYLKVNKPRWIFSVIGAFVGFGLMLVGLFGSQDVDLSTNMMALFIPYIIGTVFSLVMKNKYDNVAVETRGGKIIRFSVKENTGKSIMEQIEEEKRNWEISKKNQAI